METGDSPAPTEYSPAGLTPPSFFLQRIRELSAGIYPQKVIDQLRGDGYNPIILGYQHGPTPVYLSELKDVLSGIKREEPEAIKVAYEIIPARGIRMVKEIISLEEKSKKLPLEKAKEIQDRIKEFKEKLLDPADPASLIFWILENGFDVIPIESEEKEAKPRPSNFPREFTVGKLAEGIEREIYGLRIMAREKPDIIMVGWTHALKYDILLGRNGERSLYLLQNDPAWDEYLELFEDAYNLYRRQQTRSQKT